MNLIIEQHARADPTPRSRNEVLTCAKCGDKGSAAGKFWVREKHPTTPGFGKQDPQTGEWYKDMSYFASECNTCRMEYYLRSVDHVTRAEELHLLTTAEASLLRDMILADADARKHIGNARRRYTANLRKNMTTQELVNIWDELRDRLNQQKGDAELAARRARERSRAVQAKRMLKEMRRENRDRCPTFEGE